MTAAELEKPVLINIRVTTAWRDFAHDQARKHGMNLSAYIKTLIELAAKTDTTNAPS